MNLNLNACDDFQKGFSLLEMMFALVAISAFLAAFAPVITNKFSKETEMIFNNNELITSQECDLESENIEGRKPWLECTLCYANSGICVTCGGVCPEGKRKNKAKCTCE